MAKRKASVPLKLFLNALPLGTLSHGKGNDLTFSYSPVWLARENSFPISRSLPLTEEPYEGNSVYAYFDNLLPDNISMRQRIAARMHVQTDHVFDLLSALGRDCAGALQFVKTGEKDPVLAMAKGTLVSNVDMVRMLKNL